MVRRVARHLTAAATVLVVATPGVAAASGPPTWTQTVATTVSERRGAAEAYDAATGQLVLFGGDNSVNTLSDTWTFDGTRWELLRTAHAPMARTGASMVYDPVVGRIILFGGDPHMSRNGVTYLDDTWTFDGQDWSQLTPAHTPGTRAEAATAWDDADSRILLFGGLTDATGFGQDTWTFDGVDWSQQNPPHVPPARHGAGLAYSSAAHCAVMFGGLGTPPAGSTSPYLPDTWTWAGDDWTQADAGTAASTPLAPTPQGRWAPVMTPIPGGAAMLFGGYWDSGVGAGGTPGTHLNGPSSSMGDTWTYGTTGWTRLTVTGPPARYQAAAAWDPALGAAVVYGGCCNASGGFLTDTWLFDGTAWTERERTDAPSVRDGAEAVADTDHGDVVLFGGFGGNGFLGETWIESGGTWRPVPAGTAPAPVGRFAASMAYDSTHHETILFAGQAQSADQCSTSPDQLNLNHLCNDTWTFDGATWTKSAAASANPPSYRSLAAMAYDAATGQTVMFGGFADQGELGDTWTFDGTSWTQQKPATSPQARYGSALVYDPTLQRLVLFGGEGTDTNGEPAYLADTWTWDGSTWTRLSPASSPPPLYAAGATWDPDLGGVLVAAGQTPNGSGVFGTADQAWLFDGVTWRQVAATIGPGERYFAPLAWDAGSDGAVLFGGLGNLGLSDDAWALAPGPAPAVPEFPAAALAIALAAAAVVVISRRTVRSDATRCRPMR